jgi:hypothetical protein
MCTFSQDYDRANGSPDRMDALVWGLSFLFDRMTARRRGAEEQTVDPDYKLREYVPSEHDVYRGKSDTSWMSG